MDKIDFSANEFVFPTKLITGHYLYRENRVLMSNNRLFTFFDTKHWSLDSIIEPGVLNKGELE